MAYTCPAPPVGGRNSKYMADTGRSYTQGQTLPTIRQWDAFEYYVTATNRQVYYEYDTLIKGWRNSGYTNGEQSLVTSINGKTLTTLGEYNDNLVFTRGFYEEFGGAINTKITSSQFPIPQSITRMGRMFYNCVNLTGFITVNANPIDYTNWLYGTTQPIKLRGISTKLSQMASGYSNVSVYKQPIITQFLTQRTSNGELSDEGTNLRITLKLQGDSVAVAGTKVVYQPTVKINGVALSADKTPQFTVSSTEDTIVWNITDMTFDLETSYVVSLELTDSFVGTVGSTVTVEDTLSTAFYTMDFLPGGKCIAFGCSSSSANMTSHPNGLFMCAMDADFKGDITQNGQPISGGGAIDLLWTNPSPDSAFAAQTITVTNSANYNFFLVELKYDTRTTASHATAFVVKWTKTRAAILSSDNTKNVGRDYTFNADGTVTISTGYNASTSPSTSVAIPTRIYGVKL